MHPLLRTGGAVRTPEPPTEDSSPIVFCLDNKTYDVWANLVQRASTHVSVDISSYPDSVLVCIMGVKSPLGILLGPDSLRAGAGVPYDHA